MAGGVALGIMMIPLIMRTTEELLLLVPSSSRLIAVVACVASSGVAGAQASQPRLFLSTIGIGTTDLEIESPLSVAH